MSHSPLGLAVEIESPDGTRYRLDGQAGAGNVPQGMSHRTLRGDGFADAGFTVARRIDRDWPDLSLFNTVRFVGEDGSVAYEGRIASQPRSFDAGHSIQVNCAGWMAHAKDKKIPYLGVDQDFGQWAEPPLNERVRLATAAEDMGTLAWANNGVDGLALAYPAGTLGANASAELWYAAPSGETVGKIMYNGANVGIAGNGTIGLSSADSGPGDTYTPTLDGTLRTLSPTTARRYAYILGNPRAGAVLGAGYLRRFTKLAAYGNHGLTTRTALDPTMPDGLYVSDVLRDVFGTNCPLLSTAGIEDTTYPVGQVCYRDPIYPYDLALDLNKYHLWELGCWEDRTVSYAPADLTDYDWEIRLDELVKRVGLQGDSTDDLANGITVSFTNVATGQPDYLTPDAHSELQDTSPDNPANIAGIDKWTDLSLSFPCTTDDALQLGRAALAEFNQPKAPGEFEVEGYIKDRAGHYRPVWEVRAGQTIAITSSTSLSDRPRMIVETSHSQGNPPSVVIGVDSTLRRLDAYFDRVITGLAAANIT